MSEYNTGSIQMWRINSPRFAVLSK